VLVKLNDRIVIGKDDIVDRFLLLSNSHDGSGSVSIRFTPIRVVCQNTLNFALKDRSGAISVRHTRNIADHLATAQAAELKRIIEKAFKDAETLFGKMALISLSTERTDVILELLFPRSERQKKAGLEPERWHRIKSILDNAAVTPIETKGTLWALYNAITRDEDYRKSPEASSEARLERVWFGSGHDLKLKALSVCRKQLRTAA
jgi:phage/plasmid-like protein (TIGR03299 family)